MQEGPNAEKGYWYPGDKIESFMNSLPDTDKCENQYAPDHKEKILIMTHDDEFCETMYELEVSAGAESTWFLLADKLNVDMPRGLDIQLHFDKQSETLGGQIAKFEKKVGTLPRFNRNHRLLWKSGNLDFPLLAMNDIKTDSTLIGIRPFRPCINGKIIPIWELPFCISDRPSKTMALYNMGKDNEAPFRNEISPIVVLAHPFAVCNSASMASCFHDVLELVSKYSYTVMNVRDYYDKHLRVFV